jgi:6-pyruvoyltetrahydropterin/6-carboxytetrahydropterin synthase
MSPRLTAEENEKLFGAAASPFGHGHNYRARLTFQGRDAALRRPLVSHDTIEKCLASLRRELDHKNLNQEVPGLKNEPITTENLARYIHRRVGETQPVHRIRLHERDDFFAEYWETGDHFLGLQLPFNAAHCLHSRVLGPEENVALYGKCNNARGHGHRYVTEATIGGPLDERSGTLAEFAAFQKAVADSVAPWKDKHLDIELPEFSDKPSTGENIVQALWPRFDSHLHGRLARLRLWETANNRFTLRKT